MIEFLQRLWQRKLVQWMLAYIAAAFALIQVVDVVGGHFGWPATTGRYLILALTAGFFVALVLSWYHGERGAQRFGGGELLIIALLLAIGGLAVGHFGPLASLPQAAPGPVTAASVRDETSGRITPAAARPMANAAPVVAAQPIPAKSIAVLPFENLSSDKENEYFVSGMQDLILAKLGDIGELKVISRTSTMQYKSRPGNLKKVAAELGVATILEGSVQKRGNQVLINVQLINAATDAHLWAQSYTRTLDNVFGVEGEVAEKIASSLNARLSPTQAAILAAVPTSNPAAYDLFVRAEQEESHATAIQLYRKAIAVDPGFALAYAQLSRTESSLARMGGRGQSPRELYTQARADADQALKLAPNLAASHLALGFNLLYRESDYAAALKAFNAALTLRPNDAGALAARGMIERAQGGFDAAIGSFMQALVREPRSTGLAFAIGYTHMMVGHYPETRAWMQQALALEPANVGARVQYSRAILLEHGDVAGSLAAATGDALAMKELRMDLLVYQRKFRAAIALLDSMPDEFPSQQGSRTALLADYHRFAGDLTRARALHEQALKQDRAELDQVQGVALGGVWNSVGFNEIGLGNVTAGLAAIAKAEAMLDQTQDAVNDPSQRRVDAMAYALAGRADLAVPVLAKTLSAPGGGADYSPALLWLDPYWDPIRHDPGFEALLKQYAKYKPAVTYDNPTASSASTK